ncbi:hypothetical protein DL762_001728 [Monosporascus cannonballus]|uniref:Nucleotidyl transferase AbiEii/AbiGii toxin family protein n=1 Tax=Monosporascus cannonballus TaxID=155416 RepID=A0ABY0HGU8_9PEZI|nr:hypothetical protein DL762_001728 [Monosporascus cannonballus]
MDLLFSYLGLADFEVLYQVSKELYKLKDSFRRKHLNINTHLRDFVANPEVFRYQLGKYDALISGGFALNFFELGRWKVPNLDILIRAGNNADEFEKHIRDQEGYETDSNDNPEVETEEGRRIFSSSTRPGMELRVIRTNGPPIQAILTSSYTTASVNFITWNKAYSIFPVQTVIQHRFYPLKPLDDDFGSVLNELGNQGWTTRDVIWPDLAADVQVRKIHRFRRVGDRSSLVIPLSIINVPQASTPDFVIEYAQLEVITELPNVPRAGRHGFQQGPFQQGAFNPFQQNQPRRNQFPWIQCHGLSSPALRHEYTLASESWRNYVMERLRRWAWVELHKVEPGKRPEQFINGIPHHSDISLPEEFQVPKTWDYADDQIPEWYREWEQMKAESGASRFRQ